MVSKIYSAINNGQEISSATKQKILFTLGSTLNSWIEVCAISDLRGNDGTEVFLTSHLELRMTLLWVHQILCSISFLHWSGFLFYGSDYRTPFIPRVFCLFKEVKWTTVFYRTSHFFFVGCSVATPFLDNR